MKKFIEYTKIHLISLQQDQQETSDEMESLDPASKEFAELDFEYNWLSGQIAATQHLLEIAKQYRKDNHE